MGAQHGRARSDRRLHEPAGNRFPDEAANASDRIYSAQTVLTLEETATGEEATFNFVINTE